MRSFFLYAFFVSLFGTLFSSCEADVFGCTDPESFNYNEAATIEDGTCIYLSEDQLYGIWLVDRFQFGPNDGIAIGAFSNVRFQFKDDGTWLFNATVTTNGSVLVGGGTWTLDNTTLTTTFAGNSASFCSDVVHQFEAELTEDQDRLNLLDSCEDGTPLDFSMVRT